ncbi:MAG: serine/threonine-protein phosphatase [Bacteroidales bacterium]|nr:serine/threonine-protein phosphatase [Bacteroidales bacterium]
MLNENYETFNSYSKENEALSKLAENISKNASEKMLIEQFIRLLERILKIPRIALFAYQNDKLQLVNAVGVNYYKLSKTEIINILSQQNDYKNIGESISNQFEDFNKTIIINHKKNILAVLLIGDDENHLGIGRATEINEAFIYTYSQILFTAIENKRLFRENLKKDRFKNELNLAKSVESMLIKKPEDLPHEKNIDFFAFYKPFYEMGGDFYDVFKLSADEFGFCIADVSGKGVSAALLMANLKGNLQALFNLNLSLKEIVIKLNTSIVNLTQSDKFITLFIARYNTNTRELSYINAGHNPPVLFQSGDEKFSLLESGCFGIGMLDQIAEIKNAIIQLKPNSKLICFTDGISESYTTSGIEFGHSNFMPFLNQYDPIETTVKNILNYFNEIVPTENVFDDTTILGVSFK